MTQMWFNLRLTVVCMLIMACGAVFAVDTAKPSIDTDVTQGALRVVTDTGVVECPLKHTSVVADISGFIARVTVTQTFYNPYDENIEAIYVFPLPNTAAVDDMTMVIGSRKIIGVIKRRADARALYEQAVAQGMTASLLEQERPNIFTQTVGNIKPKTEVKIVISYIDVLKYDMGTYEFHFPMVVGPRYIPGAPISDKNANSTGTVANTTQVPDASRITPPALKPGQRNGHDIALSVMLDAGVPFHDMKIVNHIANVDLGNKNNASVVLSPADSFPNKDFVMRYTVVGEKPEMAVLTNCPDSGKGYFMLMVQPKFDESLMKAPPREVVFLIDISGSMRGAPTEKIKQAMREFFKLSKTNDTLQVITFASQANKLFEKAVPATTENTEKALNFTNGYQGGGGTEMMKGINMVLDEPIDPERKRVVVMLTDGFIGNEAEIIAAVGKKAGDKIKFWTIGIGSTPNRFLLDGVAKQGGGMSGVLELNTDPFALVTSIVERMHKAQLQNVKIDWNGLQVYDTYPRRIPELWPGRPIIVYGRYADGGKAPIKISGVAEGKTIEYSLNVLLPNGNAVEHDVLPKVWARQKIDDLSDQMIDGNNPQVVEEITNVALEYKLMSQYTSFVAVDTQDITNLTEPAKPPRRMVVPVPIPDGTEYGGFFGMSGDMLLSDDSPSMNYDKRISGEMQSSLVTMTWASPVAKGRESNLGIRKQTPGILPQVTLSSSVTSSAPTVMAQRPQPVAPSPVKKTKANTRYKYGAKEQVFRLVCNDADNESEVRDWNPGIIIDYTGMQKQSTTYLTEAQELQKKDDLSAALLRYQQSLILATVSSVNGYGRNITAASTGIQDVSETINKQRVKDHPMLAKTVILVIRDSSLYEALQQVKKAAGINITFTDGCLVDAAELSGVKQLRVTYLDLRNATIVQALDWILTPAHLTWSINNGDQINVTTTRRMPGLSAWVYKIGDITTQYNLPKIPNEVKPYSDPIGHAVRMAFDIKENDAQLINATQLLVFGDAKQHANVLALLQALKDAKTDISKVAGKKISATELAELQKLQKTTAVRWVGNADYRDKQFIARERNQIRTAINTFTMPLLISATHGEIDTEALTELQIAWNNPELNWFAENTDAGLMLMRSAWAINQANRLQSKDKELNTLAALVNKIAVKQLPANAKALKEKPIYINNYLGALYQSMLLRDNNNLSSNADFDAIKTILLSDQSRNQLTFQYKLIASEILSPSKSNDEALAKAITDKQIGGDNIILLTAVIAKERGGIVAQTMRENMPEMIKREPVDGNIIVYANYMTERVVAQKEK